jgi:hypothetical protein
MTAVYIHRVESIMAKRRADADPNPPIPPPRRSGRNHPSSRVDQRKRHRARPRPPEYHDAHNPLRRDAPACLGPVLSVIAEYYMDVPDHKSPFRHSSRRDVHETSVHNRFSLIRETTTSEGPVAFPSHVHVPYNDVEEGTTFLLVAPIVADRRAGIYRVQFRRLDRFHSSSVVMLCRFKEPVISEDGQSLLNYIDVPRVVKFLDRHGVAYDYQPRRLTRLVMCDQHAHPPVLDLNTACGMSWCNAVRHSGYLTRKYQARDVHIRAHLAHNEQPESSRTQRLVRDAGICHDTDASRELCALNFSEYCI